MTTDASKNAIGGVLSHEVHLVIYVSKRLLAAESRFCNNEREHLAIVYDMSRLCHFLCCWDENSN